MQLHAVSWHLQQGHVLCQYGIDTGVGEPAQQFACGRQFVFVNDGVHRYVHARAELVGVAAKLRNVADAVAGGGTCSSAFRTYVNGIGSVVDGSNATLKIFCRR